MADYNQGDIVQDYFSVVDSDLSPLQGVLFSVDATEDPDGQPFDLTVVEIDNAVYKVVFTAAKVGDYYYRIVSTNITPEQAWEETITIGPVALYGAATGVGAYTNTLNDLIRRVAVRLGDFRQLTATEQGAADGTTFVDQKRLSAIPASSLKGASITIVSPNTSGNYNIESRVGDSSESTQTLTIYPPFPEAVAIGQIAWVTNLQSKGFWKDDYINAINEVISGSSMFHKMPVDYTYPGTFLASDPSIPVPLHMTHVSGVQYVGPDSMIYTVPFSDQNVQSVPGWSVDFASGRIIINGSWQSVLNEGTIRLTGYGRPAELVNPTDYTTLNVDYVVPRAASILRQSKGDQKLLSSASMMSNDALDAMLGGITIMAPNTIQVR